MGEVCLTAQNNVGPMYFTTEFNLDRPYCAFQLERIPVSCMFFLSVRNRDGDVRE
jgi:hypothetical protein